MSDDSTIPKVILRELPVQDPGGDSGLGLRKKEAYLETQPLRILLVDDFEPLRSHVASMLRKRPGFQVFWEVGDGLEAVRKAEELKPDLILLDLNLPTISGIEAARQIRHVSPNSKILFLTAEQSFDIAEEALGTGALGYVIKLDAATELLPAVEAVLRGKRFVSNRFAGRGLLGNT